ncbi:MAG: 30S ribosome-binding factor RbfA [Chitinophagales bacterium]|nr:30S ribosome-binding factor RbfA [Chitinophagales bacterium]
MVKLAGYSQHSTDSRYNMESRRQSKVASVLQKAFSEVLLKHGSNYYGNTFVTITDVRTTPDLLVARFYMSVMDPNRRQAVMAALKENSHEIRRHLGNKLKSQLRRIPELEFFLDETLDEVFRIDELLKQDKLKGGNSNEEA